MITIALTKGRIEKDTVKILAEAGFDMDFMADKGRNLIFIDEAQDLRFLLVKAPDVASMGLLIWVLWALMCSTNIQDLIWKC